MRRTLAPAEAEVTAAGRRLVEALGAVEQELIEPRAQVDGDRLHFPSRAQRQAGRPSSVASPPIAAPTRQALEVFDDLSARADRELARWRALRDGELRRSAS